MQVWHKTAGGAQKCRARSAEACSSDKPPLREQVRVTVRILQGDCREVLKTLPDESVHCVVTSPPYWGLRDYGVAGQIGLEDSPQAFVANIVSVFDELRRVLRADGTAWLNLGDSYASYRDQRQVPQTIGTDGLSYPPFSTGGLPA